MKKILSVLLILVMAVCLVNLNNSFIKAEDENDNPVSCNGIVFNNGTWKNGGQVIGDLSYFGISYDSSTNTATFSKSITTSIFDTPTFVIETPLNIVIEDDISITQTANNGYAFLVVSNQGIKIDGKGNKLTIESKGNEALTSDFSGKDITLKNIDLVCKTNTNGPLAIFTRSGNINLQGNVSIEAQAPRAALGVGCDQYDPSDVKFSDNATLQVKKDASGNLVEKYKVYGGSYGLYVKQGTATLATSVKIEQKAPTADPKDGEMPYDETNGFTGTTVKTAAKALTARFTNVKKDGSYTVEVKKGDTPLVENQDYTVEEVTNENDSIKVILKDTYLDNLDAGTHVLNININGNTDFKATLTVKNAPAPIAPEEGTDEMSYDMTKGFVGSKIINTLSTLTAHIGNVNITDNTITVKKGTTTLTKDTDYTITDVKQGQTDTIKLTFDKDYLNGLDAGVHEFNINIDDTFNFVVTVTVSNPKAINPTPGTDEMSYDSANGFKVKFAPGKASTATAHFEGDKEYLDSVVTSEGTVLVEGTDYEVNTGSIKVTFKESYLSSLPLGKQIIQLNLDNGVTFKVTIAIENPVSPSPFKKDESCEKVIGPTWHWNNDKGICEDYGVVGTSTR